MTQPDTTPAPETLDEQIARLTAERDAARAAAAPVAESVVDEPTTAAAEPAPAAPAGPQLGDFVQFSVVQPGTGLTLHGPAFLTQIVEPYDVGDGTMSDPQYLVSPLTQMGILLTADNLKPGK